VNGVVVASEKKVPSPLVDASTVEKTAMLTANVGVTYSGMGPDFRVLVNKGRKAGQKYWLEYHDPIPVALLARELATVMQEFTQSGGVRPFGVSLLVAGYDDDGPQLYQVRKCMAMFRRCWWRFVSFSPRLLCSFSVPPDAPHGSHVM
jgi:20S proteasome subunit alpha 2